MAKINIDLNKTVGRIKPLHSVGQPPLGGIGKVRDPSFHYLTEANIPYSRLHDVDGAFGGGKYVDIPNIFRDFDKDENDPESYDFAFTDALMADLMKAKVEPYFRLGVTIENYAEVKSYYIDPPSDYEKWARICEHIIAHYNEGWANGYYYNITYWEIWNEPDDGVRVSQMWNGTAEDYYRLYDVTAKHLKNRFPDIKVGGYAATGFEAVTNTEPVPWGYRMNYWMEFFHGFMKYIKEHNSPIDFFSWHCYRDVTCAVKEARYLNEQLKAYGYEGLETHLNEWNPYHRERGTAHHSASVAASMLALQYEGVEMMNFYDARMGSLYGGLFNPLTYKPWHAYYSLVGFGMLYKLKKQVELTCDTEGIYAVCASDGNKRVLMISNVSGETKELEICGFNTADAHWYVIDDARLMSWLPATNKIENNQVLIIEG